MNNYDYREAVKEDVKNYLKENLDADELIYMTDDKKESLYNDMLVADSVTGNRSLLSECLEEAIEELKEEVEEA